jgi:hypothetical protein
MAAAIEQTKGTQKQSSKLENSKREGSQLIRLQEERSDFMKILKPLYLILAISMLALTHVHQAQAQSSGTDWASICHTVEPVLVQPCNVYVYQDGTFTQEGERAFGCIRNGVLMAGGAIALGVPTPIIIGGLRILAGQTGCDNIVNWNLVNRNDLTTLQNLLPNS